MDVFYQLFIVLILGYVCASVTDDSIDPMFQQIRARLSALEEQSKIQLHRIAELESRDLAGRTGDKVQQHRIAELESRDLAQQITIGDMESTIRTQQQQMEELNRTLVETNEAYHALCDIMAAQNEDTIEECNEDYSTGNNTILARRRRSVQEANVAFTVILVHPMKDMGENQNVVFDSIETNIGNAYNAHQGVFTAPVAGTYVFHVTLFGFFPSESYCKMVVNGIGKAQVYAHGDYLHHDQGSQMIVVRLNAGDDVAIQNIGQGNLVYGDGRRWTTFSGFLLRTDA